MLLAISTLLAWPETSIPQVGFPPLMTTTLNRTTILSSLPPEEWPLIMMPCGELALFINIKLPMASPPTDVPAEPSLLIPVNWIPPTPIPAVLSVEQKLKFVLALVNPPQWSKQELETFVTVLMY